MTFKEDFINDAGQLPMRVASLIENYGLEKATNDAFGWNDGMIDKLFDGVVSLEEGQLREFLALKGLKGKDDEDIDVLADFLKEHGSGSEPEGLEPPGDNVQPDVGSDPPAEQATVDPDDVLVEWRDPFGDGHGSVRVDGKQYGLMDKKKSSVRSIVSRKIDEYRLIKNMTLKDYAELLDETPSLPGNLRTMNVTLTQERVEKWAGKLGITVSELLGVPLNRIKEVTILSVDPTPDPTPEEADEPELGETEKGDSRSGVWISEPPEELKPASEEGEGADPIVKAMKEMSETGQYPRLGDDVDGDSKVSKQSIRDQRLGLLSDAALKAVWEQSGLPKEVEQVIIDAYFSGEKVTSVEVFDILARPALVGVLPKLPALIDSPLWEVLKHMSLGEIHERYGSSDG